VSDTIEGYIQDIHISRDGNRWGIKVQGLYYGTFDESVAREAIEVKHVTGRVRIEWVAAGVWRNIVKMETIKLIERKGG